MSRTVITKDQIAAARHNPVTLIIPSSFGFGPHVVEAWLIEHGSAPYAQYASKPFAVYVPKGKRNPRKWQCQDRESWGLILKGHGHDLAKHGGMQWQDSTSSTEGVTVQTTRFSAFDPRNVDDMNAAIAAAKIEVVADFRAAA